VSEKETIPRLMGGANPYDILGYMAPGGTAIMCCFFFEFWVDRIAGVANSGALLPTYSLVRELSHGLDRPSWAISTIFLIATAGAVYITGHVIASVSAMTIERTLVQKGHGYPINRFLGVPTNPVTVISRSFYRALFLWTNIYIILRYIDIASAHLPDVVISHAGLNTLRAIEIGLFALIAAKLLVSNDLTNWAVSKGSISGSLIRVLSSAIRLAAAPYDLVIHMVERTLALHEPLPPEVRERFIHGIKQLAGVSPSTWRSEAYWFAYIRVRNCGSALSEPAMNWLRLYAFARNLSAAFYLAFLYSLLDLLLNPFVIFDAKLGRVALLIPLTFFLGAFVMLGRYYYLYASYYTKYLIRVFVYSENGEHKAMPEPHE
jgi:hypothetical protein